MSTDTESPSYTKIDLNGFDREAMSMIRELEADGWSFRRSTHGAVGHAPDGEATISISRRSGAKARRHVRAEIDRWRRKQNVIPAIGAWKTSKRVLECTWPDGTVDYLCVYEDCGYTNDNPRAVSQHYGATHTIRGESSLPPAALSTTHTSTATRAPVPDAVSGALGQMAHDIAVKTVEMQNAAATAATKVAAAVLTVPTPAATEPEPPATEPEPEPEVVEEAGTVPPAMESHVLHALTPDQERRLKILDQVVKLVSAPVQAEVDRLTREVEIARAERDAFRARLEQVTSDLDGLRSLIDGIVGSR